MPRQFTIWTTLPNGRKRDAAVETLRLSVFVSPRLSFDGDLTSGTLDAFPDFLDWPARLRSGRLAFKIVVDDDVARSIDASVVTEPQPSSELWRALFDEETPVLSHRFMPLKDPVSSYPASALAGNVSSGYATLGKKSPFAPAKAGDVKDAFSGLAGTMAPGDDEDLEPLLVRIDEARGRGAAGLADARRDLADNLLRHSRNATIEDKLARAAAIAGDLARASPTLRPPALVPRTASPYAQFAAFHRRPVAVRIGAGIQSASDDRDDIVDFHRIVSALGEYPHLLRRLGLVIDLEVASASFPTSSFGALRHLRAVPEFAIGAGIGAVHIPVTKYIHDDGTLPGSPLPFRLFAAAPRRAAEPPSAQPVLEIVGGLLNLRIPVPDLVNVLQFDIVKFDVDGAATKVLNAINAIVSDEEARDEPIDRVDSASLPALRTSGISLVRSGQADALAADQAHASVHETALQTGGQAVLFAEDLVRGYRIDVRRYPRGFRPDVDPEQPWRSLHHRVGAYTFRRPGMADLTQSNIVDEGFVQPAIVQENVPPGTPNPVYVHESYCHWQGWSLSAPPPANPTDFGRNELPDPPAAPGLQRMAVAFEAQPGTLPRLRFGSHYQLRARIVDLAGNGLTVEEADVVLQELAEHRRPEPFLPLRLEELDGESLKQADMEFRRYEPVAAPALVPRRDLTQAEAIDVMVVRSNGPSTTTAGYAVALRDPRYKGFNDRHVAPPKASQRMSETHGVLDGAFGADGEPGRFFTICKRQNGTLNDPFVVNLRSGEREMLADVIDIDPGTGAESTIPNGIRFVSVGPPNSPPGDEAENGYTVHFEERLRLPWLPDPVARGAALFGLPGVDNQSLHLEESTSPGQPGRLVSRQGDNQPLPQEAIDALGFVTKIGFPPAPEWPELLPFILRLDGLPASAASNKPTWTEEHGSRMLTVRLAPAEVRTIWISCFPTPDDVDLFGLHHWWRRLGAPAGQRHFLHMAQHGALTMLTPARKVTLVHAVQQPIIAPQPGAEAFEVRKFVAGTHVHIAGEFKIHGLSTQKLDLSAVWTEPDEASDIVHTFETHVFETPIHLGVDQLDINTDLVPIAQFIEAVDRIRFLAPTTEDLARSRRWLARQEFGDTKHRRVTYSLVAMTRFREYFPDAITSDSANLTRTTRFEDVVVPNSVQPPGLEISSIIPTFRWDVSPDRTESQRHGGFLRVYLGHTWFATGTGEALAVLGDAVAGDDPLHVSPDMATAAAIKPQGLPPVTVAGPPAVTVHPFKVRFDATSGLWYGDLSFDVRNAYFPFVKLKLARFQEHSLPGMQLSPVVETGIHQLQPNRAVLLALFEVVEGHPGQRKIDIAVTGAPAPAAALAPNSRSVSYTVEVDIEERSRVPAPDQRDKDLGWTRDPTLVPVRASSPLAPQTLWKGHVLVPAVADRERRIVVQEFEIFASNACAAGQGWLGEPAGGGTRRLIYADVIPIT
jgi:hypothetical protein